MRIIDISQPLRPDIPVWPGDQAFDFKWSARIAEGSAVNVGSVFMSLHTGTHADAPVHVSDQGASISKMPLATYIGPAYVVETVGSVGIVPGSISGLDLKQYPRILFKTRREPPPQSWNKEFAYLTTETAHTLGVGGAILVGLDTPSVDPPASKTLDVHHALNSYGIANVENLNLSGVVPGPYTLIAFPLSIEGADASPVRAVLIEQEKLANW